MILEFLAVIRPLKKIFFLNAEDLILITLEVLEAVIMKQD